MKGRIAEEMRWQKRVDRDKMSEGEEGAKRSWLEEREEKIVQKHWGRRENATKHKEEKACSALIVW